MYRLKIRSNYLEMRLKVFDPEPEPETQTIIALPVCPTRLDEIDAVEGVGGDKTRAIIIIKTCCNDEHRRSPDYIVRWPRTKRAAT